MRGHAYVRAAERNVRQTNLLCQKASKRLVIGVGRWSGSVGIGIRWILRSHVCCRWNASLFSPTVSFSLTVPFHGVICNARSSPVKEDFFPTSNLFSLIGRNHAIQLASNNVRWLIQIAAYSQISSSSVPFFAAISMNDCTRSLRQDWTQSRLYNSSRTSRRDTLFVPVTRRRQGTTSFIATDLRQEEFTSLCLEKNNAILTPVMSHFAASHFLVSSTFPHESRTMPGRFPCNTVAMLVNIG